MLVMKEVSLEHQTTRLDDKPKANQEGFEVIEWCCHGSSILPIPPSNVGDVGLRIHISDPQYYLWHVLMSSIAHSLCIFAFLHC
jgi:hypothetical protein